MSVSVSVSVFVSMSVSVSACVCVYLCVCLCTCQYACVCICIYLCVCVCVCVRINTSAPKGAQSSRLACVNMSFRKTLFYFRKRRLYFYLKAPYLCNKDLIGKVSLGRKDKDHAQYLGGGTIL